MNDTVQPRFPDEPSSQDANFAQTEDMGALRERVRAALSSPNAMARFRERLAMSRRLEDETGPVGGYSGQVAGPGNKQ